MPSSAIRRLATGSCASVLVFGLVSCSHPHGPTGTIRDRAACTQLGNAYAGFNASNGGKPPIATYRRAIATARQADNTQLRVAILDWVGVMASPASGKSATGAPYATQECRVIGQPLNFGAATQAPLPSVTSSGPSNSVSPTTDGDNEAGGGGD